MIDVPKLSAYQMLRALESRHHNDIFVSECKTGSTWFPGETMYANQHMRCFDAWTMRRSYKNQRYIGYEIKVSRGDFLRDRKISEYLPFCNQLYIACPAGMLTRDEMPAEVGLIWVYQQSYYARTIKRAPIRGIEIPIGIFQYILFSRVFKIVPSATEVSYGQEKGLKAAT